MKKLFTIVSILMLAISCNTNKHISGSAIGLVNLQNYAAKVATGLPYDFNYMVITNQLDFDATFGIARSGNISITYPSFNGQTVVACIAQPTTTNITIRFDRAEVAGKEINVYCSTIQNGEHFKDAIIPAAVATVPKLLNAKKVNFFANGEKVMTKLIDYNSQQTIDINAAKENNGFNEKPVVLKRVMRRPAVI